MQGPDIPREVCHPNSPHRHRNRRRESSVSRDRRAISQIMRSGKPESQRENNDVNWIFKLTSTGLRKVIFSLTGPARATNSVCVGVIVVLSQAVVFKPHPPKNFHTMLSTLTNPAKAVTWDEINNFINFQAK